MYVSQPQWSDPRDCFGESFTPDPLHDATGVQTRTAHMVLVKDPQKIPETGQQAF